MRSRIVGLALLAAFAALVLFGVPLAIGLDQYAATEERSSLQRLADFAARSVQEDMAHDRVPARLPDPPGDAVVALYDDDGELLLGDGPARGDEPVDRALRRGVLSVPRDQFVVAAPVSDTHDVVGVVRVAVPAGSVTGGLLPIWLGMGALAGLVLLVVWLLARRLALRLTRPLQQLAVHAGRLGDGDFGVRPEPTGIREVDLVGTALGGTARRLDDLLARERAFSAEASHQLRTPLAGLRLRLESTLDRPDRLTRATVEDGLASIDRLERTIDELLLLARENRALAVPVDLAQLLAEAEDEWRDRLATDGRAFTTALAPGLPNPTAGAAAVRQIMAVLLDNACQHGAGAVSLVAREAGPDAIALEVSDGGPGIPEHAVNGGPGRQGMGVALARRLAEAEGGRLVAQRSPSVVSLLLPVLQPDLGAPPAMAGPGGGGDRDPDRPADAAELHAPLEACWDGRAVAAGRPIDAPARRHPPRGGRTPGWRGRSFLSDPCGRFPGMTRMVATEPNDLGRFFIERANAGDVDGLVALYEPDAVLAFPPGSRATGHAEIRKVYEQFVAAAPVLSPGLQHPALVADDLALTATTLSTGEVTVEIARRQPDGSWLWVVDEPALAR